jgi:hypothetical protein
VSSFRKKGEERIQMANGKGQMANGFKSEKWQIADRLKFALSKHPLRIRIRISVQAAQNR